MDQLLSLRHFLSRYTWTGPRLGLDQLILDLADTCLMVRQDLCDQALHRSMYAQTQPKDEPTNVHGELQKPLDLIANAYFLQCAEHHPRVHYFASEELPNMMHVGDAQPTDGFVLLVDPLDGSSNIDVNISVGSILSVLPIQPKYTPYTPEALCCQAGQHQYLAAYCLYGPATQLVLSFGEGTHIFTLDIQSGQFYLSHQHQKIPPQTREFAINAANQRHWHPAIQAYIQDCCLGQTGPRHRDFNMRWVASLVADVHRILIRGGIFLYPADRRPTLQQGRLRLTYEASPMAFLVTQAGGQAITDQGIPILSLSADSPHTKTPLIMGSTEEVNTYLTYDAGHRS